MVDNFKDCGVGGGGDGDGVPMRYVAVNSVGGIDV